MSHVTYRSTYPSARCTWLVINLSSTGRDLTFVFFYFAAEMEQKPTNIKCPVCALCTAHHFLSGSWLRQTEASIYRGVRSPLLFNFWLITLIYYIWDCGCENLRAKRKTNMKSFFGIFLLLLILFASRKTLYLLHFTCTHALHCFFKYFRK